MLRINSTSSLFRNTSPKFLTEFLTTGYYYGIAKIITQNNDKVFLTEANSDFLYITGQTKENLLGKNLKETTVWNDSGQLWRNIALCLSEGKTQILNWAFNKDDQKITLQCSIIPTFDLEEKNDQKIASLTLVVANTTATEDFKQKIQHFNYFDHLTNLPNKNYLNEFFDHELSNSFPNGEVAILLINLLKFQRVNESFGYAFGDDVILEFVKKIKYKIPEKALFFRFEGDKFAILIGDSDGTSLKNEAESLASLIHHEFKMPVRIDQHNIHLELSIGIAIGASGMKDSLLLIQQAHIAMQRLNNKSKSKTLLYQPELQTRANSRLKLEIDLREAIKRKELSLDYQPIINLQTGGLIGFESLCRWRHPERGMVSPMEFIPLAEESGLIVPLGNWALRESCMVVRKWIDRHPGFTNIVINVNVTGLQLLQDDFVSRTREALNNAGITGQHLKLEITESTLIENSDLVRDILLDLKALGVSLAIDDFGTGYSSLSYLNRFPADTLKIDKSFVNRMNSGEDNYKIIYIISSLAQSLGMNLVAEGIENEHQMTTLKNLGCQAGQGFLFSKPLSFDEAVDYIRKEPS